MGYSNIKLLTVLLPKSKVKRKHLILRKRNWQMVLRQFGYPLAKAIKILEGEVGVEDYEGKFINTL